MVTSLCDVINDVCHIACQVARETIFRLQELKLPLDDRQVVLAQVVFDFRTICGIVEGTPYIAKL